MRDELRMRRSDGERPTDSSRLPNSLRKLFNVFAS
jgi:hypothetical protein